MYSNDVNKKKYIYSNDGKKLWSYVCWFREKDNDKKKRICKQNGPG